MIDRETKLRALRRELAIRKNVYPKRVMTGKMKRADAEFEISVLEAIIEDYVNTDKDQLIDQLLNQLRHYEQPNNIF